MFILPDYGFDVVALGAEEALVFERAGGMRFVFGQQMGGIPDADGYRVERYG